MTYSRFRRRYARKRGGVHFRRSKYRPVGQLAHMAYRRHTFFDDLTFNTTALGATNAASIQTYRANSVWDPDYAAGGSTAAGWAEMDAHFQQYFVKHADLALTAFPTDVGYTSNEPLRVVVYPSWNQLHGTTVSKQTIENSPMWKKSRFGVPLNPVMPTLRHRFTAPSGWPTRAEDDDLSLSAGNPIRQQFFNVTAYTGGDVATSQAITVRMKITYYVLWFAPKPL